ncbi:disulfide bond formation protein DsbG [Burkholderia sp. MBR-1]|uniref:disulfide bond formation protein DsbG n=1 Tax=Burkholderia sp. MBR-1 TaxID=2732364 RepID=UPI0015EE885C|nr:disulfide bond formation protein DsbG [Burkholderia sp. MBR-1]QMI49767.1 disulfide bond formation protein DsbG [Burkholderia sp. MBR-1]
MKALTLGAAALVLGSFAGIARAADTSTSHATPAPGVLSGDTSSPSAPAQPLSPLIARLTKGMTDVKTFPTPNGMIGVIAKGKGKPIMMYVDPRGTMVVYGLGFDLVKNTLLGADLVQAEFNVPAGKLTPPAAASGAPDKISGDALARLKGATYIETVSGTGRGPLIYAFVEPNCIWCRRAWPALSTAQKTPGSLLANATIRWIPLAFSDEASQQVLAALHSDADGFERLNLLFNPTAPVDPQKDPDYKKVTSNLSLFSSLGDTGTPTFYALATHTATSGKRIEGWGGLELFRQ